MSGIETNNVVERLIEWLKATAELGRSPDVDPAAFMELVGMGAAGLLTELQSLSDRIDELEGALLALYAAEKIHDPDDWRGEPAMIQAWEALGRPQ